MNTGAYAFAENHKDQSPPERKEEQWSGSCLFLQGMRARRCGMLALLVGLELITVQPAAATSPTEVLEVFYARANAILRRVDPLGDLEPPRQAIRDLVH